MAGIRNNIAEYRQIIRNQIDEYVCRSNSILPLDPLIAYYPTMELSLTNKHALVCGASQGIGLASAVELANLGASVTLFARNETRLKQALATLPVSGSQSHKYLVADFDDPDTIAGVIATAIAEGSRWQIVVNNSGGPPGGPIVNAQQGEFETAFNRHLLSSHVIAQAVLPFMKEGRFGRIVNVISTSVKQPLKGLGVSNTIRGAVASWAKTLATEVAPFGITVNNVLPGATATSRLTGLLAARSKAGGESVAFYAEQMKKNIPAGRFAQPEEVAAAIAFLCSPAAAYINGINLPVDGGRTGSL
jgi:3-oxoacyl-[acyl-carrier protein] reductase